MTDQMKKNVGDSVLLTVFSFLAAIALESIFRSGNKWILGMLSLFGRHGFFTLFATLFFLGYVGVDYLVLRYLNRPSLRISGLLTLFLVQAFLWMLVMPH